jgi:endonuclease/exonuclease/phosphatase family metal-dependent hydrolase
MRVLTWNLFHGRSTAAGPDRDRFADFAALLAGWEWDVALLQECPPWWPADLGRACQASARMALTSRNQLFALRRALGRRRPELMKSSGGCDAILVRGERIDAHRTLTLRWLPERRRAHAVRLASGLWVGNLHAQVHSEERAQADGRRAGAWLADLAGDGPAVLGGDFNVREPQVPGWTVVGGRKVDHVLGRGGIAATGATESLVRGTLSDHRPLRVPITAGG